MPIEIGVLAATAVTQILLPYVKEGAQAIAKAATEKFGDAAGQYAVDVAGKVWDRITGVFNSEEDKATLSQFEKRPDKAASLIQDILEEKLSQDPKLRQDLEALVDAPSPTGNGTGAQIIGATYAGIVDLRGGTISGSNAKITGLRVDSNSRPKPPAPTNSK